MSKQRNNKIFLHQYEPQYGREEAESIAHYLRSGGWLTEFTYTRKFEDALARFVGAKYCSVVSNGTMSLFLALKALNIGRGDEVIVPNLTISATPNAVLLTGATPVFVDIAEEDLCMSIAHVSKAFTARTKAVMHVSLNGRAGTVEALRQFCKKRGVFLVEDAAQSLGSFYHSKHLGTFGIAGSFSFSMQKIVTTGQGGAVVTNSRHLYETMRRLRDFGRSAGGRDFYETVGWNFKFTDLQAVFGIAQLRRIDERMRKKKRLFQLYEELLSGVRYVAFINTNLKDTTPWFIDVLVEKREQLIAYLNAHNIGSRPIYPALHTQPAYHKSPLVKMPGPYPVSEKIATRGLWLPSSFSLTSRDVVFICETIQKFYRR